MNPHFPGPYPFRRGVRHRNVPVRVERRPSRLPLHDVRPQTAARPETAVHCRLSHGGLSRRRAGRRRGAEQRLRHASVTNGLHLRAVISS